MVGHLYDDIMITKRQTQGKSRKRKGASPCNVMEGKLLIAEPSHLLKLTATMRRIMSNLNSIIFLTHSTTFLFLKLNVSQSAGKESI